MFAKTLIAALAVVSTVDAYPSRLAGSRCFAQAGSTVMGNTVLTNNVAEPLSFNPPLNGTEFEGGQTYTVSFTISSGSCMIASNGGTWATAGASQTSSACSAGGNTGVYISADALVNFASTSSGVYSASWTAPASGVVTFWVSHNSAFYGQVTTESMRINTPGSVFSTAAPTTPSPTTAASTNINANLCNGMGSVDTSALAGFSDNDVLACWGVKGSEIEIRMQVKLGFYGALGISTDNQMPNTDIYWISYQGSTVTAEIRWASAKSTPAVETDPTYMANLVKVADGTVAQITFTRPAAASGNRVSMESSNFVLMATGAAPEAYHGVNRLASASVIDFAATGSAAGGSSSFSSSQKIAHGAIMVVAWIFLGPTAIFNARFMKKIFGPLWFKIHMYSMILVVLLTILGIIIIATDSNVKFSDLIDTTSSSPDSAKRSAMHAKMGVAIGALAGVQMLLGIFRKQISNYSEETKKEHEHGPRRWLFNYMHWILGFVLEIITLVNVYSGFTLGPVDWVKSPVKAFYWVAVIMALVLFVILEILRLPGYFDKEKDDSIVQLVARHAFALFAAGTFAATVTIVVIVADS